MKCCFCLLSHLSNRGSSLLTLMAAVGISGVISMVGAQLIKNFTSIEKYSRQVSSFASQDMMVRAALTNGTACKNTFAGFVSDDTLKNIVIRDGASQNLLWNGQVFSMQGVKVNSLKAKGSVPADGVSLVQIDLELVRLGTSMGAKSRYFRYYVNLVMDSANVVQLCMHEGGPSSTIGMSLLKYEEIPLPVVTDPTVRTLWIQHPSYPIPSPFPVGYFRSVNPNAQNLHQVDHIGPVYALVSQGNRLMVSSRLAGSVHENQYCHNPALWGMALMKVQQQSGVTIPPASYFTLGKWACGNSSLQTSPPFLIQTVPGENYHISFIGRSNRLQGSVNPYVNNSTTNFQSVSIADPMIYVYHYLQAGAD